jgi:Spy/CpxP family protein refolding chaperone
LKNIEIMKVKISLLLAMLFGMISMHGQMEINESKQGHGKSLSAEQRAEKQTLKRSQQLSLSTDQQLKWKNVTMNFLESKEKLIEAKKIATSRDEKKRIGGEQKYNRENYERALLEILTPEQEVTWKEIKQKEAERRETKRSTPQDQNK